MCMEKRLNKTERTERVLEAIIPLVADKGQAATTKELAKAAGVSEALLYKLFPNKMELYEALKEYCCVVADKKAGLVLEQGYNFKSLVEGMYLTPATIFLGHPEDPYSSDELHFLILHSILDQSEFANEMFNRFGKWVPDLVKAYRASIESGHVRKVGEDPELLFWSFHNLTFGSKATLASNGGAKRFNYTRAQWVSKLTVAGLRLIGVNEEVIDAEVKGQLSALSQKYLREG